MLKNILSITGRGISVCSSLSVISLDPEDEIGLKTPTLIKMSTGIARQLIS